MSQERVLSTVVSRERDGAVMSALVEERMQARLYGMGCVVVDEPEWSDIEHWTLDGDVLPMRLCLMRGWV